MAQRIAITGGIGSGKTCVLEYLQTRGYSTFSCDAIYKEILQDKAYIAQIQAVFPTAIVEGNIDKRRLANIIFTDEQARERLNHIAHPVIMQALYKKMKNANTDLVFAEVPLLFEGGYEKDFDGILVIERSPHTCLQSITERDGLSQEDAKRRIQAQRKFEQWLNTWRTRPNVWLLQNAGDMTYLQKQIDTWLQKIRQP